MRRWTRPSLVSSMVESTTMCQKRSYGWTLESKASRLLADGCHPTHNIIPLNLCRSSFAFSPSSNDAFTTFQWSSHSWMWSATNASSLINLWKRQRKHCRLFDNPFRTHVPSWTHQFWRLASHMTWISCGIRVCSSEPWPWDESYASSAPRLS